LETNNPSLHQSQGGSTCHGLWPRQANSPRF
jgi:hypothetical protein